MSDKLTFRITKEDDAPYLKKWLLEPGILEWFPMDDEREVDDSVRIWVSYFEKKSAFTALLDGTPCGMGNLYIQPYQKLLHQCLFSIIVSKEFRGKGIGTKLLEEMIKRAKNDFKIETLHLEVYEGNPAKHLYDRMGFKEYGRHPKFLKKRDTFWTKILMEKAL